MEECNGECKMLEEHRAILLEALTKFVWWYDTKGSGSILPVLNQARAAVERVKVC